MMGERGILYIATGEEHIRQAKKSANQVKDVSPRVSVTLISDQKSPPEIFDRTKFIENPYRSSRDKVENILRTDYERTILLDTDTYVARDDALPSIFEVLDRFDVVAASDPYNRGSQFYDTDDLPSTGVPHALPWVNTGVLGFKSNETVEDAFSYWQELYTQYTNEGHLPFDQIPFHQVIYETDIRYGLLPPEYNFILKAPQAITEEIRILHTIEGIDNGAEIIDETNTKIVNTHRTTELPPRWMFSPVNVGRRTELLPHPHHKVEERIQQLKLSIQERGFYNTLRSLIRYATGGDFHST